MKQVISIRLLLFLIQSAKMPDKSSEGVCMATKRASRGGWQARLDVEGLVPASGAYECPADTDEAY